MAIRLTRRTALATAGAALWPATAGAQAPASLPAGPIKIMVGFPAGGATDVQARLVAEKLRERTGRSVIVENKAGASGTVAGEALKNATPDGNTLLLAPIASAVMAKRTFPQIKLVCPIFVQQVSHKRVAVRGHLCRYIHIAQKVRQLFEDDEKRRFDPFPSKNGTQHLVDGDDVPPCLLKCSDMDSRGNMQADLLKIEGAVRFFQVMKQHPFLHRTERNDVADLIGI